MSLNQPQFNSTIKLIKRLDDLQLQQANKLQQQLNESELERINEKASSKLNLRGSVYNGLVSVEPDEEDFIRSLEIKQRHRTKPQVSATSKSSQKPPDLMEFYPNDLIKEFPEVNVDLLKPQKIAPLRASLTLVNDPIDKYFKWN